MTTFANGDIIVRDDGKYPENALVVDGRESDGCLLAHPVGGGMQLAIPASEAGRFQRVEEAEMVPVFTPGMFSIEGMDGEFAGWSDGSSWNGWEQPSFSREVAMKVLRAAGPHWKYDEETDEFVVATAEDGEFEFFPGERVQLGDGESVTVYFIGAGSWIWDKVR